MNQPQEKLEEKAENSPVSDAKVTSLDGSIFSSYTYPVRTPNEDLNEFIVKVRAQNLRKARQSLKRILNLPFGWQDLCLFVASSSLGGSLGGFLVDLPPWTWRFVLFWIVCPVAFAVGITGYMFLKKQSIVDIKSAAKTALDMIPDPEDTT